MPVAHSAAEFTLDLHEIDDIVGTIVQELGIPVRDAVNKIGLDLWRDVTRESPVDLGTYRAAWHLNENTPDLSTPEPGVYGPPPEPIAKLAKGVFPVLFLTNAMPYAQRLEEGWSTQKAPDGVLKVVLAGYAFL